MKLAKKEMCILMRSGVQIWIPEIKAKKLQQVLLNLQSHIFVQIDINDNRTINTADISGIFDPIDLEEYTRRKNRQWKCNYGNWHEKEDDCQCAYEERQKKEQQEFNKKYL